MKPPTAAELRHRITIRTMTDSQGADGSAIEVPATYATARARMIPLSGSEEDVAHGITASVVFEVWIRYLAGVTSKMDFTCDGRTFTIDSVRNWDEKGRWLIIRATETV